MDGKEAEPRTEDRRNDAVEGHHETCEEDLGHDFGVGEGDHGRVIADDGHGGVEVHHMDLHMCSLYQKAVRRVDE